ncbi:MAG TPA: nickel-dependent hydrogenase large subunit [Burkholderiaceae bacterium]|nr:nickel-dependent hydrogenase large subunit [Burkholderiaceae bacterium]
MNPEGELIVRLGLKANRVHAVNIASSRVALPERMTRGRSADKVARNLPLLFSICAKAQSAAAAGALDAARGCTPDAAIQQKRADDVRREAIVELLTRLLIDWPRVMGAVPDVSSVARARQALPAQALDTWRSIARERIYGVAPDDWIADASLAALDRWAAAAETLPARLFSQLHRESSDLGRSDICTMPAATLEALLPMLPRLADDPTFCQSPDWLGSPVETGALARYAEHVLVATYVQRHGNTVAARTLARLVELAALLSVGNNPGVPSVRQHAVAPGTGIGLAETARGLLLHHAEVSEGRVNRYRIVAPTEWNFHPDGALSRGLRERHVDGPETARRETQILVQALDPCVACRVEVVDA